MLQTSEVVENEPFYLIKERCFMIFVVECGRMVSKFLKIKTVK